MKTRTARDVAVASTLLVSVSCATVNVDHVKSAPPRPDDCKLDLWRDVDAIPVKFVTVCRIQSASGTTLFADRSKKAVIDEIRPEACRCGADALLLVSTDVEGVGMSAGWGKTSAEIKAIRYLDTSK